MVGVLLVVPSVAALGLSAWLLASCLRLETLTGLLLTAYLVAWAEVVLGAMALSAFDAFERVGVVGVVATWLLVAAAVWSRGGRPRPVPIGVRARWLARALRNPGAVAYLGVLGAGYAYLVALGLFTPQNDGDPLVYQLTRAALWRQQQGIGIVGVPIEPRLDVNPIVAEVGQATSMILAGSERFVWLVQFAAVAALAVAAFALARRVGLGASAALYGAMLVPALPVIATQAITGLNDLVAASFVVSAAVFALGRERRELVSLTLAAALAVGTKFTTPLLLPVVAFAGALSQPVRRWPALLAAGALGAALGAGWYVVNLARTGEPDGGLAAYGSQEPDRSASAVLLTVQKLVLDSVERPGTGGPGVVAFIAVGLALAGVGSYIEFRRRRGATTAIVGFAVVAAPFIVITLFAALQSLFALQWDAVGDEARADEVRLGSASTFADGTASWFGPAATIVGAAVVFLTVRAVRNGSITRAGLALAVAPWLGVVILAVAITYDPWRGRFLVAAWVMSVALWGLLLRWPRVAVAVAAVTALTFCACLVQYLSKPSGIDTLSERPVPSIWALPRWQAETYLRASSGREAGEKLAIRYVEEYVPKRASLGVAVWGNDFRFPYLGPTLERTVRMLRTKERIPPDVEWVVASPEMSPLGCAESWDRVAVHPSGWRVYRRLVADTCATPVRLRVTGQRGPS